MLITETLRGKTLPRILMNRAIRKHTAGNPLQGKIIDLGSKSGSMSYNRFINKSKDAEITYTDFHSQSHSVKKMDLEKEFDIESGVYDAVLCFNTLEHIYNFKNVVSESGRILKKDGIFMGSTPFLIPYHADPDDFFRYTHSAIEKMFLTEGFEKITIEKLGYGPFTAGLYNLAAMMPKFLRPLAILKLIFLDKVLNKFTKNRHNGEKYTLNYFFVFRKK